MLRAFAAFVFLACSACTQICTSQDNVTRADGGVFSCVKAEDCPRPSNVLICTSTDDQARDCVSCANTQCVRFTRAACP